MAHSDDADIAVASAEDKQKLLQIAATEGRCDVLQLLIRSSPELLQSRDDENKTALFHAVISNKPDACRILLRLGVAVDVVASRGVYAGKSALMITEKPSIRGIFSTELLQSMMMGDMDRTRC